MKIIIGDPKEIATYELALRAGAKSDIPNHVEEVKQRAFKQADDRPRQESASILRQNITTLENKRQYKRK